MASTSFFFSWFVVLAIAGSSFYVFDRRIGTGWYRWWYDMTHKEPLSPDTSKGFLYNQRAQSRFGFAILISVIQSALAMFYEASTLPQEVLSIFIEVPCLMFGFYMGPTVYRLWERRERVFNTVDQIENGTISIPKEVKEMSQVALSKFKETLTPDTDLPKLQNSNVEAPPLTTPEAEPEMDPKVLMDKYLNPRN